MELKCYIIISIKKWEEKQKTKQYTAVSYCKRILLKNLKGKRWFHKLLKELVSGQTPKETRKTETVCSSSRLTGTDTSTQAFLFSGCPYDFHIHPWKLLLFSYRFYQQEVYLEPPVTQSSVLSIFTSYGEQCFSMLLTLHGFTCFSYTGQPIKMDRKKLFQMSEDSSPPTRKTVHQQCVKPLHCECLLSFFREGGPENGVSELSVPIRLLVCPI